MEQDTSLAANLRRNSVLTRDWPGSVLDSQRTVRLLNASGDQTPMFWCFNGAHEFPTLAEALGPQQPIVGMRSLHNVVDPSLVNSSVADELADHYASSLIKRFGRAPCIVGGVCQAALISYRIALRLQKSSVPVLRLITLEAELRYPFPGHMRLLFGRESVEYNPFITNPPDAERPPLRWWSYAFEHPDWAIVEGAHMELFVPENIASLANAVKAPTSSSSTGRTTAHRRQIERSGFPKLLGCRLSSCLRRWKLSRLKWKVTEESDEMIALEATSPSVSGDFAILPVWRRPDGGYNSIGGSNWISPIQQGQSWTCRIHRPQTAGPWRLWMVLCERGSGPVVWPVERNRKIELD